MNKTTNQSSQYAGSNLDSVDAIYIRNSENPDSWNPLIDALPPARTNNMVFVQNSVTFKGESNPQDEYECRTAIKAIKNMRFPLTYQVDVYKHVDMAIRDSYKDRRVKTINETYPITVNGTETITQKAMTDGDVGGCSDAGFCILGHSGTGKTTSLNKSLEDYPKLIIHHLADGSSFVQIPYIKIVIMNKFGMKALFDSFAEQIDCRLGNEFSMPYTKEMRKRSTTSSKAQYACRLINILNIGMVIIDEIQNIDFERTHSDSFSTWLGIVSETKVALCLVGTLDAYAPFGSDFQLARRVGDIIDTTKASQDRNFFNAILRELGKHQYMMDYKIEMTPEICDVFYKETGGIIERMMYLWSKIQEDWIEAPDYCKPIINAEYISETTKIHQKHIQIGVHNLIAAINAGDSISNKIQIPNVYEELSTNESLMSHDRSWIHDKAVAIVCENNTEAFFTKKTIENAVLHQESLKRNIGKTAEEIAMCTLVALRKKKSDLRRSQPSS